MAKYKVGDFITHKIPFKPIVIYKIVNDINYYTFEPNIGKQTIKIVNVLYRYATEMEKILYA